MQGCNRAVDLVPKKWTGNLMPSADLAYANNSPHTELGQDIHSWSGFEVVSGRGVRLSVLRGQLKRWVGLRVDMGLFEPSAAGAFGQIHFLGNQGDGLARLSDDGSCLSFLLVCQ